MSDVDAVLARLEQPTPSAGWLSDSTITRTVRRRRTRRRLLAGVAVLVVAGTLTGVGVSGSGSSGRPPLAGPSIRLVPGQHVGSRIAGAVQLVGNVSTLPSDPASLTAVSAADQRLTVALLKRLGTSSDTNVSISPTSLYLALGMLQNGAAGTTQRQIATALQAGDLSLNAQNSGLAQLATSLQAAAAKEGITLQSANSLWQQQGFALHQQFLSAIATYFHAGVWQTDFAGHNAAAVAAIDQWTSEQTHGKITKLFDHLDPATVLVLANALYFHAAWAVPFTPSESDPGPFTTATGSTVQPIFMTGVSTTAAITDHYRAVALPYAGKRFEAVAIMPTGKTLARYVDSLTPAGLASVFTAVDAGRTSPFRLPRFTTTSKTDLVPTLQSLGMTQAFGVSADFSALSTTPTQVAQAVQRVYLGVGEKGTTAAAVTGIQMAQTSARALGPETILFNNPFLFLIRDRTTGAILFATEVNDPTAG